MVPPIQTANVEQHLQYVHRFQQSSFLITENLGIRTHNITISPTGWKMRRSIVDLENSSKPKFSLFFSHFIVNYFFEEIRHHESSVTSHAYHHSTPDGLALSSSRGDGGGYQNRSGLLDIIQEEGARKVASYDSGSVPCVFSKKSSCVPDTQRRRPLNRPNPNEDLCFMCGQDLL